MVRPSLHRPPNPLTPNRTTSILPSPKSTENAMQFTIVADDELAPLARQLAHALSLQEGHTGAFWTVKHYKDNEATLSARQPVIFLGDHELSRSYLDVLPSHFSEYGVSYYYEGAKAVLIADTPNFVLERELKALQNIVEKTKAALKAREEEAAQSGAAEEGAAGTSAGFGATVSAAVFYPHAAKVFYEALLFWDPIMWLLDAPKRRQGYRKLQYEYVLASFLGNAFDAYVNGIEPR